MPETSANPIEALRAMIQKHGDIRETLSRMAEMVASASPAGVAMNLGGVEQPPAVKQWLQRLVGKEGPLTGETAEQVKMLLSPNAGPHANGEALIRLFGFDQSQASDALRTAGVPGVKYLDAGIRGTGTGSHNYVIWDPEVLKQTRILGKE